MPTYDLARFRTREFRTSRAHAPPGGLGCFEAHYVPVTGEMRVTVRVCPRFVSPMGEDVPLAVQQNFMGIFQRKVPEYWNDRFRLTLTKTGFSGITVKPVFEVVQSALADAHYDLKIVNNRTGNICVRTGEDPALAVLKGAKWDPYRGKLSAQFNLNAIDALELTRANDICTALEKPVTIAVGTTPGQGGLSVTAMERLRTHARDVAYVFESSGQKPKIAIRGPGPGGTDPAKTVGGILEHFGLKAKYSYEKNGAAGTVTITLDRAQLLKVKLMANAAIHNFPQFAQYAVAHEYGHMLGLPDEYMCCGAATVGILAQRGMASDTDTERDAIKGNTTTQAQDFSGTIADQQRDYAALCGEFGIVPPQFGRANPSMMSVGHQIMACHGVTVAHAIWRMTRNYCEKKDWRIDVVH